MSTVKKPKFKRCKVCKELVSDPVNCANCANRDPSQAMTRYPKNGKRGAWTLDMQEGNSGLYGDDK